MKPDPLEKQETVVQDEAGGEAEGVLIQDVGISPQELQEAGWDKDGVWWQPGFVPFDDRTRHLGGGSIVLEAIPSARSRWEAQGFVPVAGCEPKMQRPVTWKNLMRGFLWGSFTHLIIIHDHPAMRC